MGFRGSNENFIGEGSGTFGDFYSRAKSEGEFQSGDTSIAGEGWLILLVLGVLVITGGSVIPI